MARDFVLEFDQMLRAHGYYGRMTEALADWQLAAIAIVTASLALWMERTHAAKGKRLIGFRSGVLMGLFCSALGSALLCWISFRVLTCGAIKCISRHCRGYNFIDLRGHQHFASEKFLSMNFNAPSFWLVYVQLSAFTLLALFVLIASARSAIHWRELD